MISPVMAQMNSVGTEEDILEGRKKERAKKKAGTALQTYRGHSGFQFFTNTSI
jgi:mevalonate pyrophosphate decarboxylase